MLPDFNKRVLFPEADGGFLIKKQKIVDIQFIEIQNLRKTFLKTTKYRKTIYRINESKYK